MGKLDGKVAIITGSSSGIGQATAILFANEGASVTIHGRSTESLQKTKNLLQSNGVPETRISVVQGPMEDEKTVHELIDQTIKKFGKIDVLINNAGIRGKPGLSPYAIENFQYTFDVNLKSVVQLTQLAIPYLEETKGNIINVSSGLSIKPNPLFPFYAMTKAALDHFGRCYALILADKGIRINTLNPGIIATEFGVKAGQTQDQVNNFQKAASNSIIPMKRPGESDEMAKTLLFMATDATYMTGATLFADGGITLYTPMPKLD